MVTVVVEVTAAQPPEGATVFVTVYVFGVELDGVMAPVAASSVSPVVELNVPAVAPLAKVAGAGAVAVVQYAAAP